jgi:hypothetical protein
VLARAERRDGKPRQRFVAHLGSIAVELIGEVGPRRWFWESVGRKLDALALDQRQMIEAALAAVVARPSPKELAEHDRELAAWRM